MKTCLPLCTSITRVHICLLTYTDPPPAYPQPLPPRPSAIPEQPTIAHAAVGTHRNHTCSSALCKYTEHVCTFLSLYYFSGKASSSSSSSSPLAPGPSLQSRFYTLLALPFPDEPRLARRDLTSTQGLRGRAGAFSYTAQSPPNLRLPRPKTQPSIHLEGRGSRGH